MNWNVRSTVLANLLYLRVFPKIYRQFIVNDWVLMIRACCLLILSMDNNEIVARKILSIPILLFLAWRILFDP